MATPNRPFSDAELVDLGPNARAGLSAADAARLAALVAEHRRELAPPDRRLSPAEWCLLKELRRVERRRERIAVAEFAA